MILIFVYLMIGLLFVIDFHNRGRYELHQYNLVETFIASLMVLLTWPILAGCFIYGKFDRWRKK